ncbi:MAG: laccase domain-containing protein [Alphaproteobacteria bacterium]|nr:laccase domain-containing protein [Alphaproteobacteria bacterium]
MVITAPTLAAFAGVRHGFLTRIGGVSNGIYASLNCGFSSGDERANVIENRRRALVAVAPSAAALLTARQIHSPRAAVVNEPWVDGQGPDADALVTRVADLALAVTSADCAPILLADADAGVAAAAHAGWRGALGGIVGSTVEAMVACGARRERIAAAIGPCIAFASYEVGPEFPAPFLAQSGAARQFFAASARPGYFRFNLPGYVDAALRAAGVVMVATTGLDTVADPARFFSRRRSTRAGEHNYGLGLSVIALAP